MTSQLRAVLPSMAEPINFKFLWQENHLSDYTLVICSYPAEDPATFSCHMAPGQHLNAPQRQSLAPAASRTPAKLGDWRQQLLQNMGRRVANTTVEAEVGYGSYGTRRLRKTNRRIPEHLLLRRENNGQPAENAPQAAAAAAAGSAGTQQQGNRWSNEVQAGLSEAAAAADDDTEHLGPTTRSAKRRKHVLATAAEQQWHGADEAAAADAVTPHQEPPRTDRLRHRQQQATAATVGSADKQPSNSIGAEESPSAAADRQKGDCRTASSRQQPGRRARRGSRTGSAAAAAAAAQQEIATAGYGLLSPAAGPSGTPPPAAAAAAAAGGYCVALQQQQQQCYQQQQGQVSEELEDAGGGSMPAPPVAAAAAGPSQPAMVIHKELPVHGAVLSAMSEYFRALIQNWQGSDKRLQMVVQEDEVAVAEALIEFMYTGDLPSVSHEDMLRLMRLSDKFQVKNCPAACARRFADTPMEELSLETICAIFEWPGFLQDAEPFKGVTAKAWSKLLELFGDLETAWQDTNGRRQQFLELPYKAIRKLIASDELAVPSENTVLVALAEWMEANNRRHAADGGLASLFISPQHRELAELVRLQHLTPTFFGSVLKRVPVINHVATSDALQAAARYATANEATRNKLHNMPNRQQRLKVLYAPPRARSSVQRLEFTWVLDLQTVKAMIDQFRDTKVTVDRYSEPHYFNGFQWQLVLQVLEPPAKQPAGGQAAGQAAAAAAAAVDVFVGTTARIQIGGAQHLPDVLYFRGQLAAREVASGDFTFVNRMESGFVCGTAGWGFRNFLRITNWDDEDALRRFFWDRKIHLRCKIDQCE